MNEGGSPEEEDDSKTAVDSIVESLLNVPVDAILFVHKAKEVDAGLQNDIESLNEALTRAGLLGAGIPGEN